MPLSLTHPTVSLGHDPSSGFVKSYSRSTFSLNLENPHNPDSYNIYSSSLCPSMSLASARLMAQTRLESAFTRPKFHIIVWDENGHFVERFAVGGFIGDLQSKISYSLKPDIYGMDEAVASINRHGGLLDGSKERNVRDGCTGSWNRSSEELGKSRSKVCRKDSEKDRWWHTERARWTGVDLARYF
jgi:hypothetical protein